MKKKFSKSMIAIVLFVLGTVMFSGCAKKDAASSVPNPKKTVVVGLDDTFVPMGYKDANGKIVGFDVDLAEEVFKRAGLKVEFQPIDWAMKETELNSGNIDVIWNGYSITEERKEKVAFTKPYLENKQIIITLSNSSIMTKKDLRGKKVAVQSGSSSLDAVNAEPDTVKSFQGGKPVLFDTNNEALMDLEAGRTDAVVVDEVLARYYMKERGVDKFKVLKEDFGKEEYGIGTRKQDKELLDKINGALDEMKKDGASAKISEKWFGKNIVK